MKAVDTTFLIDVLRNKPATRRKLDELRGATFTVTTQINIFEILQGLFFSNHPHLYRRLEVIHELIDNFIIFDFDSESSYKAAWISADLMRQGKAIGTGDVLIAGTLLAHGCNVIVSNDAHFDRIEGLTVENY